MQEQQTLTRDGRRTQAELAHGGDFVELADGLVEQGTGDREVVHLGVRFAVVKQRLAAQERRMILVALGFQEQGDFVRPVFVIVLERFFAASQAVVGPALEIP